MTALLKRIAIELTLWLHLFRRKPPKSAAEAREAAKIEKAEDLIYEVVADREKRGG